MEEECRGIIQFLEICGVMFAIYSDNVEYNLVKVTPDANPKGEDTFIQTDQGTMDDFRIFSRSFRAAQKRAQKEFQRKKQTS